MSSLSATASQFTTFKGPRGGSAGFKGPRGGSAGFKGPRGGSAGF